MTISDKLTLLSNTKESLRQALGLDISVPFSEYINHLSSDTEWSPLELFSNGERGAWYEAKDISTLTQDADGTIPVTANGDPVGRMLDKSGNNVNAVQPISSRRMVYKASPSRNVFDKVDDEFVINVPAGGWVGTMVIATSIGTASYGVNIPAGNYALGGSGYPSNTMIGVLFRHGVLTESEKAQVENYFVSNGAVESYINETNFTQVWKDFTSLTSFPLINTSSATSFSQTWYGCTSLVSFPLINTSSATSLTSTWNNCTSLTTFPLIDTSNVTNFSVTWKNCNSLTSFPLINTSSGFRFSSTWRDCTSLTSFPLIDTSSGTDFNSAWYGCTSLTSFPLINISSGTGFSSAWRDCASLTSFPPHIFDNVKSGDFIFSFYNTNLSQDSIDGILVSLVASGIATGTRNFKQTGGSSPSAIGEEAIDTLRARGWSIAVTGGY